MRFAADNLSMLLSSDWFFNVWNLCGLQSGEEVRLRVQKGSRSIVKRIVDGCANYWDSEFSETRGLRTKGELDSLLAQTGMPSDDQIVCKRYLDGVDESSDSSRDLAIVETLCSLFLSEHRQSEGVPGQFRQSAVACIEAALDEASSERLLLAAGANAESEWDLWLRQLTPDLPTFSLDTARELARLAGSHARLLAGLRAGLTSDELNRLGDWLSKSAAELADVTLPPTILTLT
jgi:hypothetical protein